MLLISEGSVIDYDSDAIVNAANEGCISGAGVDGAVTNAGGKALANARLALPIVSGPQLSLALVATSSPPSRTSSLSTLWPLLRLRTLLPFLTAMLTSHRSLQNLMNRMSWGSCNLVMTPAPRRLSPCPLSQLPRSTRRKYPSSSRSARALAPPASETIAKPRITAFSSSQPGASAPPFLLSSPPTSIQLGPAASRHPQQHRHPRVPDRACDAPAQT